MSDFCNKSLQLNYYNVNQFNYRNVYLFQREINSRLFINIMNTSYFDIVILHSFNVFNYASLPA